MQPGPTIAAPIELAPGGVQQPIVIHSQIAGSVITGDDLTRTIRDGLISKGQGLMRTF